MSHFQHQGHQENSSAPFNKDLIKSENFPRKIVAEIACTARQNIHRCSDQEAVTFFLEIQLNHLLILISASMENFLSRSEYQNQYKTRDNQSQFALRLTTVQAPKRSLRSLGILYPFATLSSALANTNESN